MYGSYSVCIVHTVGVWFHTGVIDTVCQLCMQCWCFKCAAAGAEALTVWVMSGLT
jgi:hypothetical protein